MGMTLTQKILAHHAGLDEVKAGQLINAKLDIVLGNDITTPVAINEFEKAGFNGVFDRERVAIVLDHFVPNKDIKSATQSKQCRQFADKYDILNFYDVGQMGIEHALLPEKGIVTAGDCVIGADSHTCTYGALGAFSTGVGSTDMAAGMATGMAWFKVPAAIRFVLTGSLPERVSGKDLILSDDRGGRRAVQVDGVHRPGGGQPLDGRPALRVQHGHRGRRQERHLPGGRGDQSLPRRPQPAHAGLL